MLPHRFQANLAVLFPAIWVSLLLTSCDEGSRRRRAEGPDITQGVVGQITFEKRLTSDQGLSGDDELDVVPARYVAVEAVLDVKGSLRTVARTRADGEGRYGIGGSFPEGFQIVAYSTSEKSVEPPLRVRVQDSDGRLYGAISAPQPALSPPDLVTVDVQASVELPDRAAGAFNIVRVMQEGALLWLDATGVTPATAVVNWEVGASWDSTFFDPRIGPDGEIFVVGGVRGLEDSTNTDEFDDVVIAHEFSHFVVHNHSTSGSPGGPHAGENLLPNLAFDEALASWMGGLTVGTALYRDTIGNADGSTRCALCDSLESSSVDRVVGIGSEQSCFELLWDLTDGAEGAPPDSDGDALALSPREVINLVAAFDPRSDYPYLHTVFERLVEGGLLTVEDVQRLFSSPEDQDVLFPARTRDSPPTGKDLFPIPIAPGESLSGRVDSVTRFPGGLNVENGFHSIRYYRLLAPGGRITVRLQIESATGSPPEDLDLYVLDVRNRVMASSVGERPEERVDVSLRAGVYIIAVFSFRRDEEDDVVGNRANYVLEVSS